MALHRVGGALVLGFAGLCMLPGRASTQHAPDFDGVVPPRYQGCGMCHGTHGAGSDTRMLRVDENASIGIDRTPSGVISRSCLRCHSTASDRMQQPEFRSASGNLDRSLLGFDPTDDHPIGYGLGDDPFTGSVLDDASSSLSSGVLESGSLFSASSVDCTTCHDPHARSGSVPRIEDEIVLCTSCHENGRYTFSSHQTVPCSGCHSLHGGRGRSLLRKTDDDAVCESCHSGTGTSGLTVDPEFSTGRLKSLASFIAASASAGHAPAKEGRCASCHEVHF